MALEHFTVGDFEDKVLQAQGKVLVDFWAPRCQPCVMLGPTIEDLATEMDGKAVVGKLDVDKEPDVAMKYGIMGIPTVIVFENGKELTRLVGLRNKEDYIAALQ